MNINLTLFGQMISFALFVGFCLKFVWPPMINAMEQRQHKLAAGLKDAEKAQVELQRAQEKSGDIIKEAKQQAAALIEQANKRASQLIDEAKGQAVVEGDRIKSTARSELAQEANQAKETLRGQVAALVVAGAEKILEQSVDAKAHEKLLMQLAAQL